MRLNSTEKARALVAAFLAVCTAVFIVLPLASQTADPLFLFPASSASYSKDDFSYLSNPAFLNLPGSNALAYRQVYLQNEGSLAHHLTANALGFGFAWSSFNERETAEENGVSFPHGNLFTIGKGFFFGNTFGFGFTYNFNGDGSFDEYRGWSAGFLLRPWRAISFGFASRNLGSAILNAVALPRIDVYSIAVRPWECIILSADMAVNENEGWRNAKYLYTLQISPFRNISLFASYDSDEHFSFGLSMPIDMQSPMKTPVLIADYGFSSTKGADIHSFGFALAGSRYHSSVGAPDELLSITLSGAIDEIPVRQTMGKQKPVFADIISAIHKAATSEHVRAIVLTIDNHSLGFARAQELREELLRFKSHGGKVYAILMSSGNKNYYLASVADRVYFNPAESFMLNGLSAQVYFLRELLDKIGIKFESVRKGRYKFFNEQFTSRFMPREYRESLLALLTNLNEQFVGDISSSRKISAEAIEEMFRSAIITGKEALSRGFIDELSYSSEALNDISRREGRLRQISLEDYLSGEFRDAQWGPIPEIAVIHVEGSIVRGKTSRGGFFAPEATGDENYRDLLAESMENPLVRGIVVRVNSGGGSAVASDLMLHYLKDAKKRSRKPVVFSFGDIAASGGYYIACSGDKIFASPGTVTGSIGVVGGKVSLQKLYEKLGINKESVKLSETADLFTESRDMTEKERSIFQKNIDAIYDRFTAIVSEGRKIEMAKISDLAEGRVFTGKTGKHNKLIDEIGTIMTAIEHVKTLAGIKGEYAITHFPQKKTPLAAELFSLSQAGSEHLPEHFRKALAEIGTIELLYSRGESALYAFPYKIVIE